jgi:uncharacterized protein (TIGR03437 family)
MKSATVLLLLASILPAQTAVSITAHPGSPGLTIPQDFIGLSFESGALTTTTGFPAADPVFQRMVQQIGPGLLRFGGNSVDKLTGWTRSPRTASTPTSVMTASDADRAFAFARAVGWRVLWSLNLGHGDPATDADEAAYVYSTATDVLAGLEIGNEPDLYYNNGLRPSTYSINSYLPEWQSYADAIQAQAPGAVLTGSAAAGSITTWTATFAKQEGSRIALLTQHLYPLAPSSVNPNASNLATIAHVLGAAARTTEDTDGSQLLQIAQGQKIPWRMAETNSCYNGGQKGVSDVFASALWGVDYMFTLAGRGAAGVNFHGGGGGTYTPIANSGGQTTARPLYYALLLFRAAARGRLVPLDITTNGVNLTAYGALDTDGTLRVLVINKDLTQDAAVTIAPDIVYAPAFLAAVAMRLSAPAIDSTSGVTLGGAEVGHDGSWVPATIETGGIRGDGKYYGLVPAASALLVSFGRDGFIAASSTGGSYTGAPDSLATAYGNSLSLWTAQTSTPVPELAGVTGTITDASGASRPLSFYYVSPSQVNFLIPAGTSPVRGATIRIADATGTIGMANSAPSLFRMGTSGTAAAIAMRYTNGQSTPTPVPVFDCSSGACNTVPIVLDSTSTVYVSLYGTGIRNAGYVSCSIGGMSVPITFAGAQPTYPGLDQVNVQIPAALPARGEVDVILTADGVMANGVRLAFGR